MHKLPKRKKKKKREKEERMFLNQNYLLLKGSQKSQIQNDKTKKPPYLRRAALVLSLRVPGLTWP